MTGTDYHNILNRMTAILLSFGFCVFCGMAQKSLPEKLSYVLETQDLDLGLKLYQEITDADIKLLPDSSLFDYHYLGGYLNSEIKNHEKAIYHFLEAKKVCDTALGIHNVMYMDIMYELAEEYMQLGEYDEALAISQEGIVKSLSIRDSASKAFSNLILGVEKCYEYKGWFNEIPQHLADAWHFWPKDKEPFSHTNYSPLFRLEYFYRRYEMFDKALIISDKIIEFISNKVGTKHPEIANELYMRGNIFGEQKMFNDAVECYYKALSILKSNGMSEDALAESILGNLLMRLIPTSRWTEFDKVLIDIKHYSEKTDRPKFYEDALYMAANEFCRMGNYTKALYLNKLLLNLDLPEEERKIYEKQTKDILSCKDLSLNLSTLEEQFKILPENTADWFDTGYKLSNAYSVTKNLDKYHTLVKKLYESFIGDPYMGDEYYRWLINANIEAGLSTEDYNDVLKYAAEKLKYISTQFNITEENLYATLHTVIVAKIKTHKLDNIDEDLARAETYCLKIYGADSYEYSIYLHNYGRKCQLQKKYAEAKQLYLKAASIQINTDLAPMPGTVQYLMETEKQITDEELDL